MQTFREFLAKIGHKPRIRPIGSGPENMKPIQAIAPYKPPKLLK